MALKERLVEILLEKHLASREQMEEILSSQKQSGGRLSDVVVSSGIVSEKALLGILGQELRFPCVDLARYKVDPKVIALIDRKTAEKYQIIPISLIGESLTLAVFDPLDVTLVDDLQALSGYQIVIVLATRQEIQEAIEKYYGARNQEAINEIIGDLKEQEGFELIKEEKNQEIIDSDQLAKDSNDAPVIQLTNAIVVEGAKMKASDILIEPLEKKLRVRYRVDGILREVSAPPKHMQQAIVSRVKIMSSLNIAERRIPQDGRFRMWIGKPASPSARQGGQMIDFRVSILPSVLGEKVVLRVLDKSAFTLDVGKLGYDSATVGKLKEAAVRPHGMILATGPTGSGKTTTLYSLLRHADSPDKNIVTVEDPIEYELFGVNQVQIRPEVDLTFANALRSILRQDPDVILVGEIRDLETADVAIKAALTGHLVLSTLHTNTAAGAVVRLINMGIEPFLISSSVILVTAQRLVRKICEQCKEIYEVPPAVLARLGSAFETEIGKVNFYRGRGCEECRKNGYKGRIGIIETLTMSPKIKKLIVKHAQEYEIKQAARGEGMRTLREDGLEKVQQGLTTIEEVLRVSVGDQD